MRNSITRRDFVKTSLLASAAGPLAVPRTSAQAAASGAPLPAPQGSLPQGQIGGVQYSRLMLGGNLLTGYAHARDLGYVAQLMKRYNTEAKIRETLEIAEAEGINVINSWVLDGVTHLEQHWKRGGKMKWIAQARINGQDNLDQFKRAADLGASAIHITGDGADALVREGRVDFIAKILDLVRSKKCAAGVGAHGLQAVVECEKRKLAPDFYVKTLHTHDYFTAPRPGESDDLGRYDNSWCKDPEEVIDVMFGVPKPWIAFKVLAAGAIPPQRAFRHAFDNGADFILVGMFDWQVAEDAQIARQALAGVRRLRPWHS
jgi:hypothetical protein